MGGFVALLATESEGAAAAALRDALRTASWRGRAAAGFEVWTGGAAAPGVAESAGTLLIGEAFASLPPPPPPRPDPLSPSRWARRLSQERWGGYVALRRSGPRDAAIYRDPSGALDVHLVRAGGLTLAASSLAAPGLAPLLVGRAIRRDAVARWLIDPCESAIGSALEGVETAAPGGLLVVAEGVVSAAAVWSPVALAAHPDGDDPEERGAELRLRDAVDRTSAAYLGLERRLRVEVSGGLDSAIAAAAFRADLPFGAVHFHADDPEADERRFARSVAERWGSELEEIQLSDDLAVAESPRFAGAARPSFNAVDSPYDRAVAEAARRDGVWGWVTGQGGDAAFLNLRSPLLSHACIARLGWRAVLTAEVQTTAAQLRTSVWRVAGAVRRAGRRPDLWPSWSPLAGTAPELADLRSGGSRHPWLQDLEAVEPAKRLQLQGLAFALLNNGDSRRSRVARLIHLPLQQPVLEAVLPISASRLAPPGRDRALARAAFADALPHAVARRRGKGDLTATYGRRLTRALAELRPWLLDGELRRMGLLDPVALEDLLTADGLFIRARTGDLLKLAAVEGWLRAWR